MKSDPGAVGKPKEIMRFQRWSEDTIPYVVTTVELASKDETGNYAWNMTSEELYNFMNPHNQASAAHCA